MNMKIELFGRFTNTSIYELRYAARIGTKAWARNLTTGPEKTM
jgi:hypothetical protein